ncbi:hypothetical protein ACFL0J_08085 [Candidatus Neomarinimicrobiota bacterium]
MNKNMYELIIKKSNIQGFDNWTAEETEPRETFGDIFKYVRKETTGKFTITQSKIVQYADIGLIGKSINENNYAKYPARTSRDLVSLGVTKLMFPMEISELTEAMKNSQSRLYVMIETLVNLNARLLEYLNPNIKRTGDFIMNTLNQFNLKKEYFKKLNDGIYPLFIDIKFKHYAKYILNSPTSGQSIENN